MRTSSAPKLFRTEYHPIPRFLSPMLMVWYLGGYNVTQRQRASATRYLLRCGFLRASIHRPGEEHHEQFFILEFLEDARGPLLRIIKDNESVEQNLGRVLEFLRRWGRFARITIPGQSYSTSD